MYYLIILDLYLSPYPNHITIWDIEQIYNHEELYGSNGRVSDFGSHVARLMKSGILSRNNDRRRNLYQLIKHLMSSKVTVPRDATSTDFFQGGGAERLRMTEAMARKCPFVHDASSPYMEFFLQICVPTFGTLNITDHDLAFSMMLVCPK